MGVVSYAQDKVPPKIYTQGIEVASAQDAAAGDSKSSLRSKALQEGPRASWVWGDNPNARYVIGKKFKNEGAVAAWIAASCDNEMVVSLNGKSLGRSDSWEEGLSLDVSKEVEKQPHS